jgi:hypothetical protein
MKKSQRDYSLAFFFARRSRHRLEDKTVIASGKAAAATAESSRNLLISADRQHG